MWEEICAKLNNELGHQRSAEQCYRKCQALRSGAIQLGAANGDRVAHRADNEANDTHASASDISGSSSDGDSGEETPEDDDDDDDWNEETERRSKRILSLCINSTLHTRIMHSPT